MGRVPALLAVAFARAIRRGAGVPRHESSRRALQSSRVPGCIPDGQHVNAFAALAPALPAALPAELARREPRPRGRAVLRDAPGPAACRRGAGVRCYARGHVDKAPGVYARRRVHLTGAAGEPPGRPQHDRRAGDPGHRHGVGVQRGQAPWLAVPKAQAEDRGNCRGDRLIFLFDLISAKIKRNSFFIPFLVARLEILIDQRSGQKCQQSGQIYA